MILTAHQPVYLPWLGLFHKITLADHYVHYDHVQHASQDFTARNFIRTSQGKLRLSVPLKNARSVNIKLRDIEIDNSVSWQRNHWKTIQNSYSKTPYFGDYGHIFADFYSKKWSFISEMNLEMLRIFLSMLDIEKTITVSSELDIEASKNQGIIEMCKKVSAVNLVLGTLGKNYIDRQLFKENGIGIYFQDYIHPQYPQRFKPFISHLSAIDLLFNHGPKSPSILQCGNPQKDQLEFT